MPKYRTTICQDEGFSKEMFFYAPIDLRKKYYKCNHCQGLHLVKEGLLIEKSVTPPPGTVYVRKCPCCDLEQEVITQNDNYPEYYTDVYLRCQCGEYIHFQLPVN